MKSRPTIKDVAKQAGVSRQTVSRVINNKDGVSDATRRRVQKVVEKLGYQPNAAARSMAVGHTHTLGCISPDLTNYIFASIIESAQTEARRLGFFTLTGSAQKETDFEPLLNEMIYRRVDGLLILNPHDDNRYQYLQPLIQKGMPVVYIKNTPNGAPVSSVSCDDENGGYKATQYLIELGHTSIATIPGPKNEECTPDRLAGYHKALTESGLEWDEILIIYSDWTAKGGGRATQTLLESGIPFSAIFAQNDRMAMGSIRALREAGLSVPEDISVIGYDDIPLSSYYDPALTTLRQPMDVFGQKAAQLLIKSIQDSAHLPVQVLIEAHLIERESCAPMRE